jgi:hypothetical protein
MWFPPAVLAFHTSNVPCAGRAWVYTDRIRTYVHDSAAGKSQVKRSQSGYATLQIGDATKRVIL